MTDDESKDIDELVDDRIACGAWTALDRFSGAGEYPRCPHCNREWHGLPIINRSAKMQKRRDLVDGCGTEADDTHVLCQGSDYIGPMPFEHRPSAAFQLPEWWPEQVITRRSRPSCDLG